MLELQACGTPSDKIYWSKIDRTSKPFAQSESAIESLHLDATMKLDSGDIGLKPSYSGGWPRRITNSRSAQATESNKKQCKTDVVILGSTVQTSFSCGTNHALAFQVDDVDFNVNLVTTWTEKVLRHVSKADPWGVLLRLGYVEGRASRGKWNLAT